MDALPLGSSYYYIDILSCHHLLFDFLHLITKYFNDIAVPGNDVDTAECTSQSPNPDFACKTWAEVTQIWSLQRC